LRLYFVRELYREKASGLVAHSGLELNYSNGERIIFHNSPVGGPALCTPLEYSKNQEVTVRAEYSDGLDAMSSRIQAVLNSGRGYCPVSFNCEHAVSMVTHGIASSPQIAATFKGGLLLGAVTILCGGSAKQACFAMTVGAGIGLTAAKTGHLSSGNTFQYYAYG